MSACNFPTFSFSFALPIGIPGLPSLPSFGFTLAFSMPPCPID